MSKEELEAREQSASILRGLISSAKSDVADAMERHLGPVISTAGPSGMSSLCLHIGSGILEGAAIALGAERDGNPSICAKPDDFIYVCLLTAITATSLSEKAGVQPTELAAMWFRTLMGKDIKLPRSYKEYSGDTAESGRTLQ